MRKHIHKTLKHPLIKGSLVIVIGSFAANIFNYFFNFSMLRLIPLEYGVIAGLIAIISIFSVFSNTIVTIFSKFSSVYVARGEQDNIKALLRKGTLSISVIGIICALLLALFAQPLNNYFKIGNTWFIIIVAISLFFTFVSSVANGIMQGLLRFTTFSVIYIVQTGIKLLIAVGLVIIGFHVFGAVLAILISLIVGALLSYWVLFPYLKNPHVKHLALPGLHKEITVFAMPVLLSGIGLTLMTSIDILLADHYFTKLVASEYAALSLMGRTIFFIVQPVSSVLFPLISQKKEKKENVTSTLLLCLFIIAVPTVLLSLVYFVAPGVILRIFAPQPANRILLPYLGQFSIFIAFYIFSYFLNTYFLSIGKTKVAILSLIASIAEIIYFIFFHKNIQEVVSGLILISFLLLISLLLYYLKNKNE